VSGLAFLVSVGYYWSTRMSLSKSVSKRIRVTRNGKVVRRPMAVNHFRTRKNGRSVQKKRGTVSLDYPMKKLASYGV